ncbi:MAG: hypothetical protein FWF98_02670 [Dehalococcoidia bacterium]|nr:hypothetical protein [Dehalococcoidia bacterium]
MEIEHVKDYSKPKFNSFQLKTGKMLMAGAACIALLGMAGALGGCAENLIDGEYTLGTSAPQDFTNETGSDKSSESQSADTFEITMGDIVSLAL